MGLKRKLMEFFGDDVEDDDDELEQSAAEENKEVESPKPQQPNPKPNFKEEKHNEEKKGIGSIFGVGNKKEESAKMTAEMASATKVSYVSIIRPKVFEDSRLIADAIKENKVVTFSLEFLEYEVGQRVIDFVSGAAYAMNAHLSKVTDKVLTSIPVGIDYEDIDASLGEDSKDGNYL
ncbi:cell division protein SepF [Leptotrichia sp. oral taxon 218]|uniref:cell division protein SepF n=1 Tax=Leptotrichia sp. oral taxon 218 TaxID=712361 RepID=UPI002013149E|nr:cell division protein SepF [Leptotrichia sp. oral taxon 218]